MCHYWPRRVYIGIKLDATLRLGPLAFSLEGVGIRYPFEELFSGHLTAEKFWNNLQFQFDGASLAFSQGPILISGGLIRASESPLQLDGTLLIKLPTFSIAALGSYRDMGGEPSFFVFAVLLKPIGGPAFFFVTGLAFGLGINRRLKLPDLDGVRSYPLIRAACDEDYLGKKLDLRNVSDKLGKYISTSKGDYWIAAGVRFTSFGMVDSFVLLSVAFGTRLEIGVLGLSILRVPREIPGTEKAAIRPVIVYAELVIRAAFSPEDGVLAVDAKLTENSYVLFEDCKLTGGFAFRVWFGNSPYREDFVITLGGYHPRYQVPAHYPRPERLGLRCRLEKWNLDIQARAYFALTPAAIMAGGELSIVYQRGGIRAWFIAQADFLIQWKSFQYDIEVGITIGLALSLDLGILVIRIRIEVGARIQLQGPPLRGWVEVSLWIVTVTIRFGGQPPSLIPIEWDDPDEDKSFFKTFLGVTGNKPEETLLQLDVQQGLIGETKNDKGEVTHRVVRAHGLALNVQSAIPARSVKVTGVDNGVDKDRELLDADETKRPSFGVRPLDKKELKSELRVTVRRDGETIPTVSRLITRNLPSAFWGTGPLDPRKPPSPDALVKDLPTGVRLTFEPREPISVLPIMELKALAFEDRRCSYPHWGKVPATEDLPGKGGVTISNTIMNADVEALRNEVLGVLEELDAARGRKASRPREINLSFLGEPDAFNDTLTFHAAVKFEHVGQLLIPLATG